MKKSDKIHKILASRQYQPTEIEPKWQAKWIIDKTYQPNLDSANATASLPHAPFYNLMMFPYPSAEGMHVGNMYAFTGADVFGRFKRMKGHSVFEPMGLDGFGIHSENYALKTGRHPVEQAALSEENFYRQMKAIGNSYDWSRTVETYKEDYYKWTQWLFTELFKAGLAYRKKSPVNFCPGCKTVLADEQVIDTKCERCASVVEKRDLEQWFFTITKYAEKLLNNIEKLDWTEKVKIAQREWIGKKEGINIEYEVLNSKHKVKVFTTRPDTNFGATFLALAPEHPLVEDLTTEENKNAVDKYILQTANRSEIERMAEGKEKTGVFTGSYAVNQLTGYKMPVWVSDFVLMGFGTGALVGVPGHDKRDFEFANKFGLEIKRVVVGKDEDESEIKSIEQVQEDTGSMVNSDFLNGMDIHQATEKVMDYMEEKGYGRRVTTYHLRDWLISRQRYWGPPIPMIHCEDCATKGKGEREEMPGWYTVDVKDLPVKLPFIEDFKPLGTGKAPLANHPEFYETKCPHCGEPAKRETDVSDTFLDSSWYFFRYTSTEFGDKPFDKDRVKNWLPVDMYIGGAEHSVLHLLYSRFITMFLKDAGFIDFEEPYKRFYAHGLIIKDGAKMSKSKGNVVVPDAYIKKYGADTLRTYLMFLGPFNQGGDFRDSGIEGMYKFLNRVWRLFENNSKFKIQNSKLNENLRMMHETIKGVSEDLENLRYNTAIAKLMTYYNFLSKQAEISHEEIEVYLKLLSPFAPHMTEELYEKLGNGSSIHTSEWPMHDEKYLTTDIVTIPVQVNGKLRGTLEVSIVDSKDKGKIEEMGKQIAAEFLKDRIKKTIYIPGKVLNFVTA